MGNKLPKMPIRVKEADEVNVTIDGELKSKTMDEILAGISGGTKIYKHTIKLVDAPYYLYIFNTQETPYTLTTLFSITQPSRNIISMYVANYGQAPTILPVCCGFIPVSACAVVRGSYPGGNITVTIYKNPAFTVSGSTVTVTTETSEYTVSGDATDTVTAL